jgi:hypothetical protein
VIFTAGAFSFLSNETVLSANLRYGADLVIETQGWYEAEEVEEFGFGGLGGDLASISINDLKSSQDNRYSVDPNRILTSDFKFELLKIEGIERVSTVIASPFHLTQIYSEEGKEFTAEIGDYAGLTAHKISLIGIDEVYPSTIKTEYIEFTQGDLLSSFEQLFEEQEVYTCIISEGISVSLDMHLGDIVRIVIQRGDESEFFAEFGRSSASAHMGGVMISQDVYMNIMDIPPIPYLDKIFIKLNFDTQIFSIKSQLEIENEQNYDFEVISLQQLVTQQQLFFTIIDVFFTITLDATIVICLFGLLSSSYSTTKLFTIESLIIMLSSGTVGVIVGWTTGLLLTTSMNLMSDLPNILTFPLSDMIAIFTISIIFTLIGLKILLRKSRKKKIVDIYRETM